LCIHEYFAALVVSVAPSTPPHGQNLLPPKTKKVVDTYKPFETLNTKLRSNTDKAGVYTPSNT
jgi:hypothetical protein